MNGTHMLAFQKLKKLKRLHEYNAWRNSTTDMSFRESRITAGLDAVRDHYFGAIDKASFAVVKQKRYLRKHKFSLGQVMIREMVN